MRKRFILMIHVPVVLGKSIRNVAGETRTGGMFGYAVRKPSEFICFVFAKCLQPEEDVYEKEEC